MTKVQSGIPHTGTFGFPLTIKLHVSLAGATAITLQIAGPRQALANGVSHSLTLPDAITDSANGVIVHTIQNADLVYPGCNRVVITIDFGASQRLVAEGSLEVEG